LKSIIIPFFDVKVNMKKIIIRIILGLLITLFLIFAIATAPYLWNNWVTYPRLEKERAELWKKYKRPEKFIKQNEYKGVFHMHSYWSHDSRGKLEEILPAAKKAEYDFLFFSDHPHGKLDTFPRSYNGVYDNIVFEAGTESSKGLMVSPMDSTVIDWSKDQADIINNLVKNNGLVIYVHTEKQHDWDNPDYQAMEIYNIHTDYLDGKDSFFSIMMNLLINKSSYHHWVFRDLYDEQVDILANWDSINEKRKVVGLAAVDAHNNQSYRARYLEDGTVEWVGPNAKTLEIVELGLIEKLLLDDKNKNGWAFKWEVDPYFISFNHVTNNIFSDTLSNFGIKNNIVAGHSFISFQSLAKADGFQYFAMDSEDNVNAIMGDSISAKTVSKLKALSPFPVQFQLVKNGEVIDIVDNTYEYEFNPSSNKGNYRIVAKLFLDDKWISWVFTNPIYIY
jgi:hypothetical protein